MMNDILCKFPISPVINGAVDSGRCDIRSIRLKPKKYQSPHCGLYGLRFLANFTLIPKQSHLIPPSDRRPSKSS